MPIKLSKSDHIAIIAATAFITTVIMHKIYPEKMTESPHRQCDSTVIGGGVGQILQEDTMNVPSVDTFRSRR